MREIWSILALLITLTLIGVFGFRIIEGANWLDCLYMTVITLTTVGYEHTIPLSSAGKMFVIIYLVCGLGVFTYSATMFGQWLIHAQLQSVLGRRQMYRDIEKLEKHYLVCGCGQMGQTICEYLAERNRPFVVIDLEEERLKAVCEPKGWLFLTADATDDDTLIQAGIERATGLTTVLPTDADNVYVVLSARLLRSDIQIVARATGDKAIEKMQRAGATRVVSPLATGAMKMARFMINPSVENFVDFADGRNADLELAEVHVEEGSPYCGKQLSDTDLSSRGLMVIAIRRANGEQLMPPPGTAKIHQGDCLFAFGTVNAVNSITG
ncbi:Voltage-gated potassium channel Kch [Calycomorphotria hydatis]|uniref:Voltage-gated potassium channel Kch n=2 Tax=Calycomorphotria hydatis TaxID=2528027 RepID=A0A517TCL8_9PLAN|nr:Voltage-gated potassium channel Kch [Calycomorphotria hydatis]